MKNLPVSGDTYFDIAQNRIKEINSDEKWRDMIMDYETKLLEREQDAEEKGLKRGIEKGIQQGIEQGILQGKKEGKEKTTYIQKETNDSRQKDSESTHQDWSPKRRIQNEKNTIPQSRGKADFTLVQSVKSC